MEKLHGELKRIPHLEVGEYDSLLPSITVVLKHPIVPEGVRFAAHRNGFKPTAYAGENIVQLSPTEKKHESTVGILLDYALGTRGAQRRVTFTIVGQKALPPHLKAQLIGFFNALKPAEKR